MQTVEKSPVHDTGKRIDSGARSGAGAMHALLVVDDEKLVRMTIGAKLRSAGYMVVTAASVDEAVKAIKENPGGFTAVVSDIMMGDMDGFVFRDIVRGIDASMPFFFMTALDPEEGSGFLKRIVSDPMSYYLPKSVGAEVLIKRVQRVVASRRVESFIQRQAEAAGQSLQIAAHIQRSMLPPRMRMDARMFYTTLWQPNEKVSGDLYEAMPFGQDCWLFVLGDIQGHGVSAALAMTAVQSLLKNLQRDEGRPLLAPHEIANLMQHFFRSNLTDVSYMTALICVYDLAKGEVLWITCGAPNPAVEDPDDPHPKPVNPERRGGLPIGLMPGTVYGPADEVLTKMPPRGVFFAETDGVFELLRGGGDHDKIPQELVAAVRREIMPDARENGEILVEPYKQMVAYGDYNRSSDDVTMLMFGPAVRNPDVFEYVSAIVPAAVDKTARAIGAWCAAHGLPDTETGKVQLVFEEMMTNLYDHGFDDRERMREAAAVRLRLVGNDARLSIWDFGAPMPSLEVAAGSADTEFALKNQNMSGHGRGRLIVRELCDGIERKRYGDLNETIYHVKIEPPENNGAKGDAE